MRALFLCILFCHVSLQGACHFGEFGPEVYHLKRTREGGSEQSGTLWGGHLTYHRMGPQALYWGVDGYYVKGDLEGKSGNDTKTKSHVKEGEIEGRLGYSLQWENGCYNPSVTPFVGGGYFSQCYKFQKPSPMTIRVDEWFPYASFGFLTAIDFTCYLRAGIDLSVKWMVEGKSRISEDPEMDDVTLQMDDAIQWTLDLPVRFEWSQVDLNVIPFYRFRHFGGRPNYPFDFIDTRFRILGLRATFAYTF